MSVDKNLPIYKLNKNNFKEISYNNKTYVIVESTVELSNLNNPIGRVSQRVTINDKNEILNKEELTKIYILPNGKDEKRIDLNFGWIYSIKDINPGNEIAVVVNNQYHVAKIKK